MTHPRLHKQNCAVLRRSSTAAQADTSNTNQARTVDQILKLHQMQVVHEIDLKGVSGSLPGNRTDVNEIIAAKQRLDNFDYLILPSADRFTRAGSLHGLKLLWDLAAAGITVYFVKEDLFSDEERSRNFLGFLFDAARQTAVAIGTSCAEGLTYRVLDGKQPYTNRPPFGVDRLIMLGEKRQYILRNLRNGTQQMWTPERDQRKRRLLRTFPRNPKKGTPNHYRKQKNEWAVLVPGDPKVQKALNYLFELRWVRGLGSRAATRSMNDLLLTNSDYQSPSGGVWSVGGVEKMLVNPVYTGLGIRLMRATGVYILSSKRGKPTPSPVTIKDLASQSRPTRRLRPRKDWIEQPQEHLRGYLSPTVKEAAKKGIEEWLNRRARGQKLKPDRNKHKNTGRLLSDILRSKQGDSPMRGTGGRPEYEYYKTKRGLNSPASKSVMAKLIPGRSMHVAVLECLRDALVHRTDLVSTIAKVLKIVLKEQSRDDTNDIERELRAANAQHIRLTRQLTGDDEDDKEVNAELDRLDARILRLRDKQRSKPRMAVNKLKPQASAAMLAKEFVDMGGGIDAMDIATKKGLLRRLIPRMVVDLETREVEMDIALPADLCSLLINSGKNTLVTRLCS